MNVLAMIKEEAEANPDFDWREGKVSACEFDPEYWAAWALSLRIDVTPYGRGLGMSIPRGDEHDEIESRSYLALMAALNSRGQNRKYRAVRRYFSDRVPELERAHRLRGVARHLIAKHEEYLPVIRIGRTYRKNPIWVWRRSVIKADWRPQEWRDEQLLRFERRVEWWSSAATFNDAPTLRKFSTALKALFRAERLTAEANRIEVIARDKIAALKDHLRDSLSQPNLAQAA